MFTVHVPQVNKCQVLILYQATVHNRYTKWPPPELVDAWAHLIMNCRTISKFSVWL